MHSYGDSDFTDANFLEVEDAAYFIGGWLRKWVRMEVIQIKEKFGTVRVYGGFGWHSLYSIWRPHYCWVPMWWPSKIDKFLSSFLLPLLNKIFVPMQKKAYAWRYKKAVQRWPYLYEEIVCCADFGELFEGVVPGYKHSDYWQEVK